MKSILAKTRRRLPRRAGVVLVTGTLLTLLTACGGGPGGDVDEPSTTGAVDPAAEVVARTGPIVAVRVGQSALLSGENSYTNLSQPLRYRWSFASKPHGSSAVLSGAGSSVPAFVADTRGEYRVELEVSAGNVSSQRAVQLVVATVPPERLTGPFFHQGLSSSCVNCHNDDFVTIPAKSQRHMGASNRCENCHTPLGWTITPFVDHREVFGDCSECHNGVIAIGKSSFHLPTTAECDSCHTTVSFFDLGPGGSFDHSGITGGCSECHNGISAVGKTPTPADTPPGTHPLTSSECIACHSVESFANAYPDHTDPAVLAVRCDSCHGVSAGGPPVGHPLPAVDCGACHGVVSFNMGGIFDHRLVDSSVQSCQSCHNESNGINAPAKSSAVPAHPPTSDDCATCHNTDSFVGGFDHTGVVSDCGVACHIANGSGTAQGMPPSTPLYAHMPTLLDCSACHTPGTFATGTYDHAGVVSGCNSCHDNRISVGKLENHIPTNPPTQDCADCHNTTSFLGVTFNHAGIDTSNCALCHDGNISSGKPPTHLPTAQNCFACHGFTAPFQPADSFAHVGINSQCETCHSGNPDYTAVGAIGKKVNHIPALNQCDTCHASTAAGAFASAATFLASVHSGYTRGCEGCHNSQFLPLPSSPAKLLVKQANHVPTSQDCQTCHNITSFMPPTTMAAHTGINGNCVSCHDGSFIAIGARAKTPSPPHPATSADCALCHNTTDFAAAFVDHNDPAVLAVRCDSCHDGVTATGKASAVPAHVPTTEDCRLCHTSGGSFSPAVFDHGGIVDNCASCHDGVSATGTAAKTNPPHIPISQDCSACHLPTAFAQAFFDHQGITGNCATCHDGVTVRGKHASHVPTNGDCVDCHQTSGFLPASFDHSGIVDNCAACHGAGFAPPKSASHVATNQDCGVCHTTNAFVPASFDHTGIVDNCVSCHDGTTATGMADAVPAHIPTGLDCHFCHTTSTFTGGRWVHDASSANNCDSCHSPGGGATAKPGIHLSTTEQCDVCHTTNGWVPTVFSHDPRGNYPGDHRRNPGCSACHGPTISAVIPWRYPQYAPDCAACHAGDFRPEGDHIGGRSGTVSQNRNCGGSGCHRVNDSGF